jgi:spermidine dehydrogenase
MSLSKNEKERLGMNRAITRRDFLNGMALAIAGSYTGAYLLNSEASAETVTSFPQDTPGYNPPALTGMRGSNKGSFEIAHAIRDGSLSLKSDDNIDTGEQFDLLVVGCGISGLAAAYYYRMQIPAAKILLLDNHDDFGGHARRNEFDSSGKLLITNGGSLSIASPFPFSKISLDLMNELGVDPPALSKKCDDDSIYKGLSSACFFDKETFGKDVLLKGEPGSEASSEEWSQFLSGSPLSEKAKSDIVALHNKNTSDYFQGLNSDEKKDKLSRISYKDFLLNTAKVDEAAIPFFQSQTHGLYGVGIDAVSALDCWALGLPGFEALKLKSGPHPRMGYTARGFVTPQEEYTFHFPDGNATIARLLLSRLIPGAIAETNAEKIVTATTDYSQLDKANSAIKIRLSSTVVQVQHIGDAEKSKEVEIKYAREKKIYKVKAKHVVIACWHSSIPYICPELPAAQKEALRYGAKVPIVYTTVALRNWKAFKKLGISRVNCPGMYHPYIRLNEAVNIGKYKSSKSEDEPMLVHMERTPCCPGLPEREQHRIGRAELLSTSFETFEERIRDQLQRILKDGGFDAARDIEAITVNRWPHGFTYEYNSLFDPDWKPGESPCEIARKPFGRIAIANADSAAAAYFDQSIDHAHRAVKELLS